MSQEPDREYVLDLRSFHDLKANLPATHPLAETAESYCDCNLRSRIELSTGTWGSEVRRQSREASDCTAICVGSVLAIAIKQLAANGGNNNRFSTVRNHPMAAHFWKHQLAKTAIGWVE